VTLNGKPWRRFDAKSVRLPYAKIPTSAAIEIALGGAKLRGLPATAPDCALPAIPPHDMTWRRLAQTPPATNQVPRQLEAEREAATRLQEDVTALLARAERFRRFHQLLADHRLADTYEAAHVKLALDCLATTHARLSLLDEGKVIPLANPMSQSAADRSYLDTARKLADGLAQVLAACEKSRDCRKQLIARLWQQSASEPLP